MLEKNKPKWLGRPNSPEKLIEIGNKHSLSLREITVILGICQEKTSKEIANELFLASRSVESIRLKIMKKLNIKTSIGLVNFAAKVRIYVF